MNTKILIIIPAFNEAQSIKKLLSEIREIFPKTDLVVINDASRDATEKHVCEIGVLSASLPFNLGIGGAVQTGYQIAYENHYDIAVQLDGDGQHDPRYLVDLIAPILKEQCDLCIGSRFLNTNKTFFRSTPLRRIGIRFFSRLLGWITGFYISDPTSGFRAVGKKLIKIFSDYYPVDFPEPESITIAARYHARILEIPVKMRERQAGQSSIRYFKTLYYMIKVTLAILIDTLKKRTKEVP